jgi:hypothetical protein
MRARVDARERGHVFLSRLAVPALVLLPVMVGAAGPASAVGGLVPGGSETITVALPAAWASQADQLGVSVVDLVQSENVCLAAEVESGDQTCDADEGDLAGQLLAEVAAGRVVDGACRTGAYEPLDLLHADAQSRLDGSGAQCLAIHLFFPDGDDDNVAQSDAIAFGVRTVAEGPGSGISRAESSAGSVGGSSTGAGAAGAVAAGNPGRGTAGQQNGTSTAGAVPGLPGVGTGTAPGAGDSSTVLGEQTTPVQVDGDAVAVQIESSATSIGDLVLAWGTLFLGVVLLGLFFFLSWSRRRRRDVP